MYNQTNIWQELKHKYRYGGAHTKLIFINVGFFILLNFILLIDQLFFKGLGKSFILNQVVGSSDISMLLYKPWTIITNLFVHAGFFHLLFNMIFLYVFGNIVKDLVGNSKVTPIFFLSGIFGFALFLIAYNLIPLYKNLGAVSIMGASGGVMGITFAAVAIAPDYIIRLLFLGNVKIKWIAVFYVVMDLLSLQGSNAGGSIAHLGGAFIGFQYIRQLQMGRDWGRPFYFIEDFINNIRRPKKRIKVVYKQEEKVKAAAYQKKTHQQSSSTSYKMGKQEQLDEILDKINKSGYDSLSTEEKNFLFKISQED